MKTRNTMHLGASPTIFYRAQKMRQNPTPAEELLWKELKNKQVENVKFRRQHPMDDFVVDFYAHELKLIIEVDGEYHEDKVKKFEVENRDLTLASRGMKILRFSNDSVLQHMSIVLNEIREKISRIRKINELNKNI